MNTRATVLILIFCFFSMGCTTAQVKARGAQTLAIGADETAAGVCNTTKQALQLEEARRSISNHTTDGYFYQSEQNENSGVGKQTGSDGGYLYIPESENNRVDPQRQENQQDGYIYIPKQEQDGAVLMPEQGEKTERSNDPSFAETQIEPQRGSVYNPVEDQISHEPFFHTKDHWYSPHKLSDRVVGEMYKGASNLDEMDLRKIPKSIMGDAIIDRSDPDIKVVNFIDKYSGVVTNIVQNPETGKNTLTRIFPPNGEFNTYTSRMGDKYGFVMMFEKALYNIGKAYMASFASAQSANQNPNINTLTVSSQTPQDAMSFNSSTNINAGDYLSFDVHYYNWYTGASNLKVVAPDLRGDTFDKGSRTFSGSVSASNLSTASGSVSVTFNDKVKLELHDVSWQKWPCRSTSCESKPLNSDSNVFSSGLSVGDVPKENNSYYAGNVVVIYKALAVDKKYDNCKLDGVTVKLN